MLAASFGLGEANMCDLGIGEQARRDHAVACRSMYAGKVVANNSKIIERDMSELRTAGAFTNRPNIGSGCLELVVHLNVTSLIRLDASDFQSNSGSVGHASGRNQDGAACNCLFAG